MKYLCLVLYLHISFKECTIDANIQDLVYIADHLTAEECRRLYASLNFVSYELPANLSDAEQKVPTDVPCVKLLLKWNSGGESWEGKGKTHATIERRLRQMGQNDLADWLGKQVFHQLAKDINKSLEDNLYFDEDRPGVHNKAFSDPDSRFNGEPWTTLDSILSVTLFGLLFITLTAFIRMLKLTFRRPRFNRENCKDEEEMVDLLSTDYIDSDEQESVEEFDAENGKHVNFEDLEKGASEGSGK